MNKDKKDKDKKDKYTVIVRHPNGSITYRTFKRRKVFNS